MWRWRVENVMKSSLLLPSIKAVCFHRDGALVYAYLCLSPTCHLLWASEHHTNVCRWALLYVLKCNFSIQRLFPGVWKVTCISVSMFNGITQKKNYSGFKNHHEKPFNKTSNQHFKLPRNMNLYRTFGFEAIPLPWPVSVR